MIDRRHFLKRMGLGMFSLVSFSHFAADAKSNPIQKPNILLILVDDMGYSDIGCYGGEVHTPNLDRLAEQGIRFTQFHNTAKCFPSRACLLTGLYAQQCGMDKKAGYRTLPYSDLWQKKTRRPRCNLLEMEQRQRRSSRTLETGVGQQWSLGVV